MASHNLNLIGIGLNHMSEVWDAYCENFVKKK